MAKDISIFSGGAYKFPNEMKYYSGGVWYPVSQVSLYNGGAWKRLWDPVPSNLIMLFDNASYINGTYDTALTGLHGRFPRGSTGYGTTGGSTSHLGSSHGAPSSVVSSSEDRLYARQTGSYNTSPNVYTAHTHDTTHSHGDTASNLPPYVDLIPVTTLLNRVRANSIWLTINTAVPAPWTSYSAALAKYLRFNSAYGTGGSTTHSHSFTGSISHTDPTSANCAQISYSYAVGSHSHTINHSHSGNNLPANVYLNIHKVTEDILFSDLPVGTVAFFTSATLPAGWARLAVCDNRLIYCSASSIQGVDGSDAHTHASQAFTSGMSGSPTPRYGTGASSKNYFTDHAHTYNHGHLTSVSSVPPYTTVVVGLKQS